MALLWRHRIASEDSVEDVVESDPVEEITATPAKATEAVKPVPEVTE